MDLNHLWEIVWSLGEWADTNKVFIITVAVPSLFALWKQLQSYKRAKTIEEKHAALERTVDIVESLVPITLHEISKSPKILKLAKDDKIRTEDLLEFATQVLKDEIKASQLRSIDHIVSVKYPSKRKEHKNESRRA